jgi:hypothetical protein
VSLTDTIFLPAKDRFTVDLVKNPLHQVARHAAHGR